MNTRQSLYTIGSIALALSIALTGCRKDRPDITPVNPKKPKTEKKEEPKKSPEYKVPEKETTHHVLFASRSGDTEGTDGTLDTDSVTISGLGTYEAGATAKVTITPKEGYQCDGIYFGYTSGYDAATFPVTKETALKVSEVTFEVKGNITVRALISEVEKPIVQPDHYEKNVLINEAYWREQNRKAWAEIYPHIVRPTYEEATEILELYEAYPEMRATLKSDTIYTEEPTVMAWTLSPYIPNQDANNDWTIKRIAYALADESGNIVEIYPPVKWDGCIVGQGVRTVVFPTIPEGRYTERVLYKFEGDPAWYDLPIMEWFRWMNWSGNPDGSPKWAEYYEKCFPTYKPGDVLKQKDLFTSEKIRNRTVIKRNSADTPPIPRWHSPRYYTGDNASGDYYRNMQYHNTRSPLPDIRSTTIELVNGSNQYLRGEVVAVMRQKHWFDQNLDVIDHYERTIIPGLRKLYKWGGGGTPGDRLEWVKELGRVKVTIEPSTTDQPLCVSTPLQDKLTGLYNENKLRRACNFSHTRDQDILLYWVPEGSTKAYLMQQDNHKLLNYIEKSGIPMKEWFTDSYSHPSIGHTQAIDIIKEIFDADQGMELGNRIHLYGGE